MKNQRRDGILGFHPYFDIWHNQNGTGVSSMHWLLLYPKEIPGFSFLLDAGWPTALLNQKKRKRSLPGIKPGASCLLVLYLKPTASLLDHYIRRLLRK
jgi:hypothetical protein